MIARELGVSKTTVSLALRGHPRISTATREKVEAVAKSQGYTIDPHLTRAFSIIQKGRNSTHNVIGYLDTSSRDPDFGNPFAEQVKRNLIQSAKTKGFSVTSFEVNPDKMPFTRLRQIIESRNIRYLLVPSPALIDDLDLNWENHSTIVLSTRPLRHRFNRVTTSNYQAVSVLMNQVRKKGYNQPGLIIRRDIDAIQDSECSIAFEGFRKSLKFNCSVPILYTGPGTTQLAYERWFWKHQPDVIIQNNRVGITRKGPENYTQIFSKFKKAMPSHIGRCSLNADSEMEPVSGIIRNEQEIGYSAIELMLSMIERNVMGLPNHPKTLTILSDWFNGASLPTKPRR
ncbi:MAG: hypothetical protein SynsKO_17020 [Synoicihabitans sp.]